VRVIDPQLFHYFNREQLQALRVHLFFSVPSALLLPAMLYTGLRHHRNVHLVLAAFFSLLWTGTFVTGVFFLPHSAPLGQCAFQWPPAMQIDLMTVHRRGPKTWGGLIPNSCTDWNPARSQRMPHLPLRPSGMLTAATK